MAAAAHQADFQHRHIGILVSSLVEFSHNHHTACRPQGDRMNFDPILQGITTIAAIHIISAGSSARMILTKHFLAVTSDLELNRVPS